MVTFTYSNGLYEGDGFPDKSELDMGIKSENFHTIIDAARGDYSFQLNILFERCRNSTEQS